jgi:hypothetical protein
MFLARNHRGHLDAIETNAQTGGARTNDTPASFFAR